MGYWGKEDEESGSPEHREASLHCGLASLLQLQEVIHIFQNLSL